MFPGTLRNKRAPPLSNLAPGMRLLADILRVFTKRFTEKLGQYYKASNTNLAHSLRVSSRVRWKMFALQHLGSSSLQENFPWTSSFMLLIWKHQQILISHTKKIPRTWFLTNEAANNSLLFSVKELKRKSKTSSLDEPWKLFWNGRKTYKFASKNRPRGIERWEVLTINNIC